MESDFGPAEDLDKRASDGEQPPAPAPEDVTVLRAGLETGIVAADRGDLVSANLAAIAVRIDALSNATSLLRTLVGERLADYSNQVARTQAHASRDLEDYHRSHERTLAEIEASLREQESIARRLERTSVVSQARLSEIGDELRGRIEAAIAQMGRMEELVSAGEAGGAPGEASERAESLARVEDAVVRLREAQAEDLERLHDAVEDLRAERPPPEDGAALDEHLVALTQKVDALRRRLPLRARREPVLDDATLERIAEAVARRMEASRPPEPARKRRWLSR